MAKSPIPPEVWSEAEAAYKGQGNGAWRHARAVVEAAGYKASRAQIQKHMERSEVGAALDLDEEWMNAPLGAPSSGVTAAWTGAVVTGRLPGPGSTPGSSEPKPKTHLVIPDTQVKPGVLIDHLYWAGLYVAERAPDVVIHLGDHWDMASLSSYEGKGSKYFEGKRYKADVEAGNRALEMFEEAMARKGFKPKRKVLLRGNHECVSFDTEILTDSGWKPAPSVTMLDNVASFSGDGEIRFARPTALSQHLNVNYIHLAGDMSNEMVSDTHHFVVDSKRRRIAAGERIKQTRIRYAGHIPRAPHSISDNEIRLATWVVMDGCLVFNKEHIKRIQFQLAKPRKIEALTELLKEMGVTYTVRPGGGGEYRKLPVSVIRIYGDDARGILKLLGNGSKRLPSWLSKLNERQIRVFLGTLVATDGYRHYNHITWTTISLEDVEAVQLACITNGIPMKFCSRQHASGFANAKTQYHAAIFDRGVDAKRAVEATEAGRGPVVAISTIDETLITRREGKVAFTGNSRIVRAVNDDPRLEGVIGYHDFNDIALGWEVVDFLVPIEIDGITHSHFFPNRMTGRPIGGNIDTMLRQIGFSFTMGHVQGLSWGRRELANGQVQIGLRAGSFYQHSEEYLTPQGNFHWHGLIAKHEVDGKGGYDPMFVSMGYLKRKFG